MLPVDHYTAVFPDRFSGSLLERVTELLTECRVPEYRLLDHALQVAQVASVLATAEGLPEAVVETAWLAGYLHDAGKVLVSNAIHFKPGPLTPEESLVMRRHPELGAGLVAALDAPEVIAAVRHHHERYDGSGYPAGLRGEEIPPLARLVAVADHYAALRETRVYRPSHTHGQALEHCLREALAAHLSIRYVHLLLATPEEIIWAPEFLNVDAAHDTSAPPDEA